MEYFWIWLFELKMNAKILNNSFPKLLVLFN